MLRHRIHVNATLTTIRQALTYWMMMGRISSCDPVSSVGPSESKVIWSSCPQGALAASLTGYVAAQEITRS